MRHLAWSVLLMFLLVPAASATENEPVDAAAPEVVPAAIVEAPADAGADAEMQLEEIQIEERESADDAAAAQLPPRGSFWWLVGVVVVAGVVLAVVL